MSTPHDKATVERLMGPGWRAGIINMPYHRESLYDQLLDQTPWPHLVVYHQGRITYVPPNRFLLQAAPRSPSDCTWMVPGTGEGVR